MSTFTTVREVLMVNKMFGETIRWSQRDCNKVTSIPSENEAVINDVLMLYGCQLDEPMNDHIKTTRL